MGGRDLFADAGNDGGLPQQAAQGALREQGLPPQWCVSGCAGGRARARARHGLTSPLPASRCAVYADGQICLDILQNAWSPIYDVSAVLTSIQSLLCDPNPSSPANSEAARMFQESKAEYDRRVRLCVEDSWAQSGV